jgi:hypothetical protein
MARIAGISAGNARVGIDLGYVLNQRPIAWLAGRTSARMI